MAAACGKFESPGATRRLKVVHVAPVGRGLPLLGGVFDALAHGIVDLRLGRPEHKEIVAGILQPEPDREGFFYTRLSKGKGVVGRGERRRPVLSVTGPIENVGRKRIRERHRG
jgi:hypothetical protein